LTVRDPAGTGSGWAGASSYDWGRIDVAKLAATALEKCLTSRNPVRIEPGRYTLIMEPQATFDFLCPLFRYHIGGLYAPPAYFSLLENHLGPDLPFGDPRTTQVDVSRHERPETVYSTKLGQRVLDPRVTLSCDPADPDLGDIPFWSISTGAELYVREPVRWITNGVLTALGYDPGMQVWEMREKLGVLGTVNGLPYLGSFRMEGGTTPIEEMIATTERGLFVTRFWGVHVVDKPNAIWTGTTRDGLWLIEHGKITHPVKNLRWTESPLFALNQLEQIGVAVPVFTPSVLFGEWRPPAVTPPIKVRDFSFTALEDAI
jgi:predicted Zn-dependent protease